MPAINPGDQQEFSDADFRIVATGDQSKKLKFLASGITAATTRVWTVQDKDGTVAYIQGTTTNDSAAAGNVGEYIEANVASGSATSLSTGTAKTVTSISLTAGDWDVTGNVAFIPAATTNYSRIIASISQTNNTADTTTGGAFNSIATSGTVPGALGMSFPVGPIRISLAGTTTIYLVGSATFTVSTMSAYGHISARRVR